MPSTLECLAFQPLFEEKKTDCQQSKANPTEPQTVQQSNQQFQRVPVSRRPKLLVGVRVVGRNEMEKQTNKQTNKHCKVNNNKVLFTPFVAAIFQITAALESKVLYHE